MSRPSAVDDWVISGRGRQCVNGDTDLMAVELKGIWQSAERHEAVDVSGGGAVSWPACASWRPLNAGSRMELLSVLAFGFRI